MERDFTAKCYYEFRILINQLNDDGWLGIADWFGDRFVGLKHLLRNWGILDYTTKIETYYKELLDRKFSSGEEVKQVFEAISELDISFAGDNNFGYCKKKLAAYRQCLSALAEIPAKGHSNGNLASCFNPTNIREVADQAFLPLQLYALPVPEHQFTASTFSKISQEDKKAYVSRCEEFCPVWAEKLDQVLFDPDWTDQEKLDIKFMIYSAPEPYRSVYLKYATQYKIVVYQRFSADRQGASGSSYSLFRNTVFLKDGRLTHPWDPNSPYNVLFHESGHAMDSTAGSELYSWESLPFLGVSHFHEIDGKSLHDCIEEDTRNYVSNFIDQQYPMLNEEQKDQLLVALNLSDDASFHYGGDTSALTAPLMEYYQAIKTAMFFELFPAKHTAVSDIYGGVTNNAILGFNGHKKYPFVKSENFTYWYKDGSATNLHASELWAEFYAAQMTHDEEALANIKEHFPTAYPMLEEMARQMAPT